MLFLFSRQKLGIFSIYVSGSFALPLVGNFRGSGLILNAYLGKSPPCSLLDSSAPSPLHTLAPFLPSFYPFFARLTNKSSCDSPLNEGCLSTHAVRYFLVPCPPFPPFLVFLRKISGRTGRRPDARGQHALMP